MELNIPVEELRKKKLFVATPMYGGMCAGMFTRSIADLSALCTQYGIPLQFYFLFNESLITRARNYCCLPADAVIVTDQGKKTMKWIVDNKFKGNVISFNEKTQQFEYNKVINHWSRPNDLGKTWVKLGSGRSKKHLISTSDHPVAVLDNIFRPTVISYVDAKETLNKYLVRYVNDYKSNRSKINPLFNSEQMSVLLGTVFGDATINGNGTVTLTHGYKQKEYLEHKSTILNSHKINAQSSGYDHEHRMGDVALLPEVLAYSSYINTNEQTKLLRKMIYNPSKSIASVANMLDEISLAFWYMDDGHLNNGKQAQFCSQSFTYNDHLILKDVFKTKWNIDVDIKQSHNNTKWFIHLDNKNSEILFGLISKYIHSSMEYKLPDLYKNVDKHVFDTTPLDYGSMFVNSIEPVSDEGRFRKLYDIEVENVHNFVANDTLVHNCDEFMRSDAEHLMFIDSDIGFNPHDVIALMAMQHQNPEKYDIVGGPYPKKCISWEKIKHAVDKGVADQDPNVLERFVGDYVFNPKGDQKSIPIGEPCEVLEIGTGFMMITKAAMKKFAESYKQYNYKPDHVRTEHFDGTREIMMFFQAEVDPVSKRYLSEDYWFCLPAKTMVETENGNKTIKSIIDSGYRGRVKSINKDGNVVWNKIKDGISRFNGKRNEPNSKKTWVKLKTSSDNNQRYSFKSTSDHKVFVTDNLFDINMYETEANNTKGKYVIKSTQNDNALYNEDQLSSLIGTVLGDGYISKNGQVSITHSTKQEDYNLFKQELFGGNIQYGISNGFGKNKPNCTLTIPVNEHNKKLRELIYVNGKKSLKNVINYINEKTLAFMYMDDGSLSKNGELRLATNNFDYDDHILFANHLKSVYDIEIIIREQVVKYKNEFRKYFTTAMNALNRDKFLRLISPYIHASMKYKVSSQYHNLVNDYNYNVNRLQYAAAKVLNVLTLKNFSSRLYDIEVENDHNFMANGVLVHNCQKAQEIGLKTWFCPWMKMQHVGTYIFGGSLADLATIGASATADPTKLGGKTKK